MIPMNDALVETLKSLKIKYVLGVSGANIEPFHDALGRRGNGQIAAVLAGSEVGAAFMADGLARRDNRLAVCCSTSGGGMMNLAAGIAESFADHVPVLAIIGQAPDTLAGKGAFQDSSGVGGTVNAMMLFRAISRYSAVLNDPNTFWQTLAHAIYAATTYPLGPAVLLVPRNYWNSTVSHDEADLQRRTTTIAAEADKALFYNQAEADLTSDDRLDDALTSAAQVIREAHAPLSIIGSHLSWHQAAMLDDHLHALSIPTATTLGSMSHIATNRSNYLGIVGAVGHPSVHHYIENSCDLLLLMGTAMEITHRAPIETRMKHLPLLLFDVDERMMPYRDQIKNQRPFSSHDCRILLDYLRKIGINKASSISNYQQTWIKAELADNEVPPHNAYKDQLLLQSTTLRELQPYLERCDALFLDAGNCAAAAAHYLRVPADVKSLIALGMGAMGYAIAAAIGAKLPHKTDPRPSLVIAGDGAFLMTGLELHTAIDLGLAILFVFFNNSKHGMCVSRQRRFFDSRIVAALLAPFNIAQTATGLARDNPCWTARVHTVGELRTALVSYFEQNRHRVGVIDVVLATEEIPPFFPLYESYRESSTPFPF